MTLGLLLRLCLCACLLAGGMARAQEDPDPALISDSPAPALGMGLNGISDWSTQHAFVDLMKTARPWIGHSRDQWGAFPNEVLREGGHLNAEGWPVSLPEGADRLEALLLTEQPEAAEHLRGTYVLRYKGSGKITLAGRARRLRPAPGEIRFDYAPGDGSVAVAISATNPDDPIRDISIVREDQMPIFEAGVIFNPEWIARLRTLRSVRFMDWMMTNGSDLRRWDDRPRVTDYTYGWRGVPLPVMIALANQMGVDPWFTLPHMAEDGYVRAFAEVVRDGLDPRLKAHVEYSNEVWNDIFPQARWAREQAAMLWQDRAGDDAWMQFYGLRAAEVMGIFVDVFGAGSDRLVRVVSVHTGWPGLEEAVLTAPLAVEDGLTSPEGAFDAYAVTGYFGYEMGTQEALPQVRRWIADSTRAATRAGEAEGLRRVALREYVEDHRFEQAFDPMAEAMRQGSLAELVSGLLPYHAETAQRYGMRLVMYEGGSHLVGHGAAVDDAELTDFFNAFSYTEQMAQLYDTLLQGWVGAGGTLFNAFVDVAAPSKWGSWGALRHLDDDNPRWRVLTAYNALAPSDWAPRDAAVFDDGLMLPGTDGDDVIEGTVEEDILLAGPGDDLLAGLGAADHLHGGPGRDRALLPGARIDWQFSRDGARIVAEAGATRTVLFDIEEIGFADAPDVWMPADELVPVR